MTQNWNCPQYQCCDYWWKYLLMLLTFKQQLCCRLPAVYKSNITRQWNGVAGDILLKLNFIWSFLHCWCVLKWKITLKTLSCLLSFWHFKSPISTSACLLFNISHTTPKHKEHHDHFCLAVCKTSFSNHIIIFKSIIGLICLIFTVVQKQNKETLSSFGSYCFKFLEPFNWNIRS